MGPSDFRRSVAARAGSPRLLDFSFPTRCLQSPRGARRLHSSAASPTMAGFVQSGRLAAPTLCNEAESSSIALRLAGSPRRASPWGLLLSTPGWLHVGHLFDMLITFQINREASLGLAHRISLNVMKLEVADLSSQKGYIHSHIFHSFSVFSVQSVVPIFEFRMIHPRRTAKGTHAVIVLTRLVVHPQGDHAAGPQRRQRSAGSGAKKRPLPSNLWVKRPKL